MRVKFENYDLDPSIYDEMFLPDGAPREHCTQVYETLTQLSEEELVNIQDRVTRSFSNEGITFTVYGDEEADERTIPVDCLPRVISSSDWLHLEAGLTQRVKALNLFLEDVYGRARIVHDGVIPVDMVRGCPQYRVEMRGFSPPHGTWVAICGTDLVRTNDGFMVLEDNLRVPSGVSYMLANRKVAKSSLRRLYRRSRVREVSGYGRMLQETLRELAPKGQPDPCIVLLTPGVYNATFYEHIFLARELGAELVEGRDLLVNDGFATDVADEVGGGVLLVQADNARIPNPRTMTRDMMRKACLIRALPACGFRLQASQIGPDSKRHPPSRRQEERAPPGCLPDPTR